jgi:drug/metabolite transporter (DMT)-like permease
MEWEQRKLSAVLMACTGVVAIVYGGVAKPEDTADEVVDFSSQYHKSPLIGNLLALFASLWYGLFQVIYKKFVALPNDPEAVHENSSTPSFSRLSISSSTILESEEVMDGNVSTLPVLPFGLHPNFFVSVVGLMTAALMALLFPILDYVGVEKFKLPPDLRTALSVGCVATTGLVFNAGFMVIAITSDPKYWLKENRYCLVSGVQS